MAFVDDSRAAGCLSSAAAMLRAAGDCVKAACAEWASQELQPPDTPLHPVDVVSSPLHQVDVDLSTKCRPLHYIKSMKTDGMSA